VESQDDDGSSSCNNRGRRVSSPKARTTRCAFLTRRHRGEHLVIRASGTEDPHESPRVYAIGSTARRRPVGNPIGLSALLLRSLLTLSRPLAIGAVEGSVPLWHFRVEGGCRRRGAHAVCLQAHKRLYASCYLEGQTVYKPCTRDYLLSAASVLTQLSQNPPPSSSISPSLDHYARTLQTRLLVHHFLPGDRP
jgi:hypothetical protein